MDLIPTVLERDLVLNTPRMGYCCLLYVDPRCKYPVRLRREYTQHADRAGRHSIGRADACKMMLLPAVGGTLIAVLAANFLRKVRNEHVDRKPPRIRCLPLSHTERQRWQIRQGGPA